ncbi:C45 family autoproteolytic acyltransferase/hydrolase [Halobacillus litoralis]|uniref:C45 family autoproteolytic acyltransferase/hydolase n=1 Tax=Halobacillus litoralis TaxID=45668 RepID=UPI001CD3C081|nr:C45 family peptidase [Halobacillus litoralis]MCA0968977.1 C45 family autoproteolytic acyltransferase/hydrolase [Halobacillus litoralis]
MKPVFSEVISFRGTHYAFGKAQAERLKGSPLLSYHQSRRDRSRRKYTVDFLKARELFLDYAPKLWEELEGLADGLRWSLDEVVHEYSGWQQEWEKSGCSIFTAKDFLARNYDYHPKTYEGRFLLFQPDEGMATIGPGQRIIGRTDGMNEQGLCIGYNFVNRIKPLDGLICCTLTRFVLETCRTTEEAVSLLKELPHRHSFNYVIFDRHHTSAIVEGSPRGVVSRYGAVCTNHFSQIPHENRRHLGDSHERLESLRGHEQRIDTPVDAFHFLNETDGPIFAKQYEQWSGTIHTATYQTPSLKLWFGLGGDARPVYFDFARWLRGDRVTVKRILGALDTTVRIPYTEKDAGT